jgi:hypothetical protein
MQKRIHIYLQGKRDVGFEYNRLPMFRSSILYYGCVLENCITEGIEI